MDETKKKVIYSLKLHIFQKQTKQNLFVNVYTHTMIL